TKEKTLYDTVTVTRTDTIRIKDTSITVQLLTANPWKLKEIRGVSSNTAFYYSRGGSYTGQNYDNEYITFTTNKTGTYIDPNGYPSALTWDFAGTDSSKITYIVAFPTITTTVHWENLRYKNGSLYYDEYYTQNNINEHAHGQRIPK
ncbi:MAG: hypothetical protein ACXVBJ_11960, partial [Flavisolibacter sp.]